MEREARAVAAAMQPAASGHAAFVYNARKCLFFGGKEEGGGVRSGPGEAIGPSYFFMSLVLGPLNSLLWYVPSSRYIWSSAPIFCFCKNK